MKRLRLVLTALCAFVMLTMGVPIQALADTGAGDASMPLTTGSEGDGAAVATLPGTTERIDTSDFPDDGEGLFNGYVEQRLEAELPSQGTVLETQAIGSSKLTGTDLKAYNILKEKIAEVAAGKSTRMPTKFSIPCKDLYEQTSWTADELGVDSVLVYDDSSKGWVIPQDAADAVWAIIDIDSDAVLDALQVDCPYELYWYDKVTGANFESVSLGADSERITVSGTADFSLAVAAEYSFTGATGTFLYSNANIAAVNTAIAKAKQIVDDNKEKTTYERMVAYKDAICGLTSYNHAAAGSTTISYGNPWQLIWVFDGNEATTVVCEGYSKAFQYLCDLSEFKNATCYTVTGTMTGGTGAGNHMWNIVTMPNDKNYLVDVTNSDAGSVGSNGSLFVAPYTSATVGGYRFATPTQTVTYLYNQHTIAFYGDEIIAIADTAYDPADDQGGDDPVGPDPVLPKIPVPNGVTGLVYNGGLQVGVGNGEGYTLSGEVSAVNAGIHTAWATPDEGYTWTDGTAVPKRVDWSIAQKTNQIKATVTNRSTPYSTKSKTIASPLTVSNAKGTVTYALASPSAYFSVNAKTGKVTVAAKTPANSYRVKITATDTSGNYTTSSLTKEAWVVVSKAPNPLATKAASKDLAYKTLKKKNLSFTPAVIKVKGQGTMSYALKSVSKAKYKRYFTVASKTGKVTVVKGLPKGTYKVALTVRAAGNTNYANASKTAAVTLRVK